MESRRRIVHRGRAAFVASRAVLLSAAGGISEGGCGAGQDELARRTVPTAVEVDVESASQLELTHLDARANELQPGVWTNISPKVDMAPTYGSAFVELDPQQPSTLYLCIDETGLWRTRDGGKHWVRLGSNNTNASSEQTLDSPIQVRVDPKDSLHLYGTEGVRGAAFGFWISHDAGETWTKPPGFAAIARETTDDVTMMAIDPDDFRHVLLGSHAPWRGLRNAGILETKDGGDSWIRHEPREEWSLGTVALHFLYEPSRKVGDANTWLLGDEQSGYWRTTNAGTTWQLSSKHVVTHGGSQAYYATNGVLYVGARDYPLRSTDNGVSFEPLTGLPRAAYYSVYGDGVMLYTQLSFTGDNGGHGRQPYMVSPESDGLVWSPYREGQQTFNNGPYVMRFDAIHGILYSANWRDGLWALKVSTPHD